MMFEQLIQTRFWRSWPLPASECYRLLLPRVEMGGAAGDSVSQVKVTPVLQIMLQLKCLQELLNAVGTLSWEVERSCVRPGLRSTPSCPCTRGRSWSDDGARDQAAWRYPRWRFFPWGPVAVDSSSNDEFRDHGEILRRWLTDVDRSPGEWCAAGAGSQLSPARPIDVLRIRRSVSGENWFEPTLITFPCWCNIRGGRDYVSCNRCLGGRLPALVSRRQGMKLVPHCSRKPLPRHRLAADNWFLQRCCSRDYRFGKLSTTCE